MAIQVKPRGSNALEVSVSEISAKLKRTVEDTFGSVRVRGEISGYRGPHSSGHSYFALKDDRAKIDAIIWKGAASKIATRPQEGLEVIATGRLTTYPGRSSYQIVIDQLEPAGEGALMAQLDRLRRKLAEEGLFAPERKRALPYMPRTIGVVTSPTGAVIRDILHRIADRFPVHVIVWPVRVQGETTGDEVARAVMGLARSDGAVFPRPDLIIVARGGGSLEDLWGFNDELVVRAVVASPVPVISAVGHETDTTLIDHAADHRAPTPTAAAERAVPVRADLEAHIANLTARLRSAAGRALERRRQALASAGRALPAPDMTLALPRRRFDEAAGRLVRALERRSDRARAAFERVAVRSTPDRLRNDLVRRRERLARLDAPRRQALERARRVGSERLGTLARQLGRAVRDDAVARGKLLDARGSRLQLQPIVLQIAGHQRRTGELIKRGRRGADTSLQRGTRRLEGADRLLASLSFKGVLARGYAVLRDADGKPLIGVEGLATGDAISAQMQDGAIDAVVGPGRKRATRPGSAKKPARPAAPQGTLF